MTFSVTGGPHAGAGATVTTGGDGRASFTYTGSAAGTDSIVARFEDSLGRTHTAAAVERIWTAIAEARPDRDGDGVLDAGDNCADDANADQADRDSDAIGDVCDIVLPPGDLPIVVGERVQVEVLEGEVFIQLPGAARASARASQASPMPGFRPLKGRATVPLGSVIDARRGTLGMSAAADFTKGLGRAPRLQRARLSAAIFQIRQKRRAPKPSRRKQVATTDLVLKTPVGLDARVREHEPADRRPGQGRRADTRRLRHRLVPHARRREHDHDHQRQLDRLRPLHRHRDRGRPRHGERLQQGHAQDGQGPRRPELHGQGAAVRRAPD